MNNILLSNIKERFEFVYYCNICTKPCYTFTGSIPPNQCIRNDLDCADKATWTLLKK